jgi:hypothetical protein
MEAAEEAVAPAVEAVAAPVVAAPEAPAVPANESDHFQHQPAAFAAGFFVSRP